MLAGISTVAAVVAGAATVGCTAAVISDGGRALVKELVVAVVSSAHLVDIADTLSVTCSSLRPIPPMCPVNSDACVWPLRVSLPCGVTGACPICGYSPASAVDLGVTDAPSLTTTMSTAFDNVSDYSVPVNDNENYH